MVLQELLVNAVDFSPECIEVIFISEPSLNFLLCEGRLSLDLFFGVFPTVTLGGLGRSLFNIFPFRCWDVGPRFI